MKSPGFADIAIVSCGTLSLELNHLRAEGFLDTEHLFFTTPGLHEDIHELDRQLLDRIAKAREKAGKVLVVYGGKFCYVNADEPTRTMQQIITEQGAGMARIEPSPRQAAGNALAIAVQDTHCMDMLASEAERERIAVEVADGEKVWWMTPGWIKFRHKVFKGWDKGLANENLPRHSGGAVVLDGTGYLDTYMAEHPEDFWEYSDWMGIPIIPYPVSLDRFKMLLTEQAEKLYGNGV